MTVMILWNMALGGTCRFHLQEVRVATVEHLEDRVSRYFPIIGTEIHGVISPNTAILTLLSLTKKYY
jgi:hypothetical protein